MTPIVSATILRTQSDERLLALTRQGYERAFEAIVERYRRPMMRYCRRYLPEARAEDAVQQAFISAWSAIRDGTEVVDLRPWLYRITRNAAIDAAKRAGYDYRDLSEALRLAPAPEAELERRAVMRETLTGVAALPAGQREALLRTVVEGQSRADIAREMQISEGAVRQLVHRARMALRSAATGLTPAPVIGWAASLGGADGPIGARIAELAAGGGAAAGAGLLVKTGTVIVVAGVLAVEAGTSLEHPPPAAAGDSAAVDRAKAAHVVVASRGAVSGPTPRTRRGIRTGWDRRRASGEEALDRPPVGGSRDAAPSRSDRGSGELSLVSGSIGGSGDDGEVEDSGGAARGGDGDEDDREEDNSGPGSQTSGDDGGDGDGGHSGSDSGGDGDHSGSDSGGGDSDGDKSGSGSDKSGSGGGDGSGN